MRINAKTHSTFILLLHSFVKFNDVMCLVKLKNYTIALWISILDKPNTDFSNKINIRIIITINTINTNPYSYADTDFSPCVQSRDTMLKILLLI